MNYSLDVCSIDKKLSTAQRRQLSCYYSSLASLQHVLTLCSRILLKELGCSPGDVRPCLQKGVFLFGIEYSMQRLIERELPTHNRGSESQTILPNFASEQRRELASTLE
jgi:hypothetical protein